MQQEIIDGLIAMKGQLKEISNKVSVKSSSVEEAHINMKPFCNIEIEIEKTIKKFKNN